MKTPLMALAVLISITNAVSAGETQRHSAEQRKYCVEAVNTDATANLVRELVELTETRRRVRLTLNIHVHIDNAAGTGQTLGAEGYLWSDSLVRCDAANSQFPN